MPASNAKGCITLLCLPLIKKKKKGGKIFKLPTWHILSVVTLQLQHSQKAKCSLCISINRPRQKSFSELSHLFLFPSKVYSAYTFFTKVARARRFPPLLILNKQFYQLLCLPGCSLSLLLCCERQIRGWLFSHNCPSLLKMDLLNIPENSPDNLLEQFCWFSPPC